MAAVVSPHTPVRASGGAPSARPRPGVGARVGGISAAPPSLLVGADAAAAAAAAGDEGGGGAPRGQVHRPSPELAAFFDRAVQYITLHHIRNITSHCLVRPRMVRRRPRRAKRQTRARRIDPFENGRRWGGANAGVRIDRFEAGEKQTRTGDATRDAAACRRDPARIEPTPHMSCNANVT